MAWPRRRVEGRTFKDMEERGIVVRAASKSGVAEEAGLANRDLSARRGCGASARHLSQVVSLTPIGNING